MVSEETPAAEAEAPTKPLFTKIGYDNEVKKIGYDDEVKIQKITTTTSGDMCSCYDMAFYMVDFYFHIFRGRPPS